MSTCRRRSGPAGQGRCRRARRGRAHQPPGSGRKPCVPPSSRSRSWASEVTVAADSFAFMVVAIAGGHGKIGLRLTKLLAERGDRVLSIIRDPGQADHVATAGGEPVMLDLETSDAEEVGRAIADADAVVFAAGAGP